MTRLNLKTQQFPVILDLCLRSRALSVIYLMTRMMMGLEVPSAYFALTDGLVDGKKATTERTDATKVNFSFSHAVWAVWNSLSSEYVEPIWYIGFWMCFLGITVWVMLWRNNSSDPCLRATFLVMSLEMETNARRSTRHRCFLDLCVKHMSKVWMIFPGRRNVRLFFRNHWNTSQF